MGEIGGFVWDFFTCKVGTLFYLFYHLHMLLYQHVKQCKGVALWHNTKLDETFLTGYVDFMKTVEYHQSNCVD